MFGMMTRQSAELENNMNVGSQALCRQGRKTYPALFRLEQAVERVLYYSSEQLPQERPHILEATEPPASWPEHGDIKFKDVVMSYRKGLPAVLKGM